MINARMLSGRTFWLFAAASIALAATGRPANALWMSVYTDKWPNGVVPVCMTAASVNHPHAARLRADLEQAAAWLSNVARVRFVSKLPSCAGKPFDAANVCSGSNPGTLVIDFSGGAFNSDTGYHAGGPTPSQMDPDLSNTLMVVSELGHALGFEHEQDRSENIGQPFCPKGINPTRQVLPQDHLRTQYDNQSFMSYCRSVGGLTFTHQDVLGLKMAYGSRVSVGFFKDGGWWLDNGDNQPISSDDQYRAFGQVGDLPVVMRDDATGGCSNNGHSRMAIYRGNGLWSVDNNRNGYWDTGDPDYYFGIAGDRPIAGVFGGSPAFDEMGVYRDGYWYLDANGSGTWNNSGDVIAWFGLAGDIPIVGTWAQQTSGWLGPPRPSYLGVFRGAGSWSLDVNGSGSWDGSDVAYSFGQTGDYPIVGDWNGDGRSKVGVYRNGMWYLDFNGNGQWDPSDDFGDLSFFFGQQYPNYGDPGTIPVVGDWF